MSFLVCFVIVFFSRRSTSKGLRSVIQYFCLRMWTSIHNAERLEAVFEVGLSEKKCTQKIVYFIFFPSPSPPSLFCLCQSNLKAKGGGSICYLGLWNKVELFTIRGGWGNSGWGQLLLTESRDLTRFDYLSFYEDTITCSQFVEAIDVVPRWTLP